jgi:hypothetical protein
MEQGSLAGVKVELTDYAKRAFTKEFFVSRSQTDGPGWYVFGRCVTGVIKLVAQPDVSPRRHRWYNVKVRPGWRLKRAAQAVADMLSAKHKEAQE